MQLEQILANHCFKRVKIILDRGARLEGYIVDVKLPINQMTMLYFLEQNKAKRYLANFNPTWIDPLPLEMIERVENIEFDEISEQLELRRIGFYYWDVLS